MSFKTDETSNNENDSFIFEECDGGCQRCHVMEEHRKSGELCDVTLKADDQLVSCHRIVLSAASPYFRAMFFHDMVESKQKEIFIKEIDATVLQALIHFMYTGRVEINMYNVETLMFGSSFLQLSKVTNACSDFLKTRFDPDNVLQIRSFADNLSFSELVEAADVYIDRHFYEVSLSKEFLLTNSALLIEIVKKNSLRVDSEEQVFEAVMKWVDNDQANRKSLLSKLLAYVKLPLLSPCYIAEAVSTHELIKSSQECRDLVDDALYYKLIPGLRSFDNYRSEARLYYNDINEGDIYVVKQDFRGTPHVGPSTYPVEIYDPTFKTVKHCARGPTSRIWFSAAVLRNKLFAVGGSSTVSKCKCVRTAEVFDPIEGVWSQVSPMHFNRCFTSAAVLGGRLYVCGGYDYDGLKTLNTVEYYIPERDEWKITSNMRKYRRNFGLIAFMSHIYAIGGENENSKIMNSVEKYNPRTGIWTRVASMLTDRCALGVSVLNNKLYVCGGRISDSQNLNSVEMYDPHIDKWQFVCSMNQKHSNFAVVTCNGRLVAIGNGAIELYNPINNCWTYLPDKNKYAALPNVVAGVILP